MFSEAWWVTAGGTSALAEVARANGLSIRPTIELEQAIDAVGGPNSWWWGGWISLGHYFWSVRDPAGAWMCGSTFLRGDSDVLEAWLGMAAGYFGEGLPEDGGLPAPVTRYRAEYAMSRVLGTAVIPPPLVDALGRMEIGGLSLVVAGNVSGMLPIPALALPGPADVRLIERAVIRVQPPAFLAELVNRRESDPFGPWPLSIACLDPVGDLPHARHGDLGCDHRLTAGKVLAESAHRSVPATRRALRDALQTVGRGASAVFFDRCREPGEVGVTYRRISCWTTATL